MALGTSLTDGDGIVHEMAGLLSVSTSFARLENLRLLRPGATYLLLCGYLSGAVALGIIPVLAGFPKADVYRASSQGGLFGFNSEFFAYEPGPPVPTRNRLEI